MIFGEPIKVARNGVQMAQFTAPWNMEEAQRG